MSFDSIDKGDPKKYVRIKTVTTNEIGSILADSDIFTLILLCRGTINFNADNKSYTVSAPASICLDEQKKILISSYTNLIVKIVYFCPTFINTNITIETIRNEKFEDLILEYSYFQLMPFLTRDFDRRIFYLNNETMLNLSNFFDCCQYQLEEQPDFYWISRARSYFMDIIQCLERIYYNYEFQITLNVQNLYNYQDLLQILSYINNHLDSDITLKSICKEFHTYRQRIEYLFKTNLNISFYKYIQNKRFEKISYYLRFTDFKSKEIALYVGISNSQNLCKFFKNMSGKSPNQFRKDSVSTQKSEQEFSQKALRNTQLNRNSIIA